MFRYKRGTDCEGQFWRNLYPRMFLKFQQMCLLGIPQGSGSFIACVCVCGCVSRLSFWQQQLSLRVIKCESTTFSSSRKTKPALRVKEMLLNWRGETDHSLRHKIPKQTNPSMHVQTSKSQATFQQLYRYKKNAKSTFMALQQLYSNAKC